MILKESELDDDDIIYPILGKPYKEPGKLLTATGSSMFFVREATDLECNPLPLKREEMKGIFQRYEKGLMLHLNKSNYQNAILISYDSVKRIKLSKRIEKWEAGDSFTQKIMALLFKYKVRESVLGLETDSIKAELYTSLSSFDSINNYFSSLDSADRFQVVAKK